MLALVAVLALVAAACGGSSGEGEEEEEEHGPAIELKAPTATITVDGDASDWAGIPTADVELEAVMGLTVPTHDATVAVAHDDTNVYVLFKVEDNLLWTEGDAHKSAAASVMWQIDPDAPAHMGAEEAALTESLGMVDIWHWELDCAAGTKSGGAVSGATDGNDPACNLDDEYAKTPFEREDDNADGAENSLTGVWNHDGTSWIFEISRPLTTGDSTDAQLKDGGKLALAYWDPDNSEEGWEGNEHVVSSEVGWIDVTFES